MDLAASGVTIYSTCRSTSLRELLERARWTEDAGYRGALVYTDFVSIDSWTAAQAIIADTATFVPLVAVQPMDMTPFALARAVSSLTHLYGRRVDINYVSGGFGRDFTVQGDDLSHDARYDRLTEYVAVVIMLLGGAVTKYEGKYYNLRRARLPFPPPADLLPTAYLSGSSAACVQAAESLGTAQLSFPLPPDDYVSSNTRRSKFGSGMPIGIIARDDSSEAWRIAHKRFPIDQERAEKMQLLLSASISEWQRELASLTIADQTEGDPYWIATFRYSHTFCPYLVGSYDEVGQAVTKYLTGGARTFIIDIPQEPDDLHHARIAIERGVAAMNGVAA
jgi:alkanesulfonate monooxygenase